MRLLILLRADSEVTCLLSLRSDRKADKVNSVLNSFSKPTEVFVKLIAKTSLSKIVKIEENSEKVEVVEYPDEWWYRVYLGVLISNILVIAVLWTFSTYFSS